MVIHCRPPVYDAQERAILDLRKNDYLAADSKEGRNQVLKEMLVAIFNYWTSQGQVITNPEQTSKVSWILAPASYILPVSGLDLTLQHTLGPYLE